MTRTYDHQPDPKLDLVFERYVDVPRGLVWEAWTKPDLLKQWFCPKPWQTVECEIDLRPGGLFKTVVHGPEGERLTNLGCYLEAIDNEKLVWTNALVEGFRPAGEGELNGGCGVGRFVCVLTLEPKGKGTAYKAILLHNDEATRNRHEEIGFHDGWGAAYEQMVELLKRRA